MAGTKAGSFLAKLKQTAGFRRIQLVLGERVQRSVHSTHHAPPLMQHDIIVQWMTVGLNKALTDEICVSTLCASMDAAILKFRSTPRFCPTSRPPPSPPKVWDEGAERSYWWNAVLRESSPVKPLAYEESLIGLRARVTRQTTGGMSGEGQITR